MNTVIKLPEPRFLGEVIKYLGYTFPNDDKGKIRVGRLFRAMVTHLTAHAVIVIPPVFGLRSPLTRFIDILLRDLYVDVYLCTMLPERVYDIAYANAFSRASVKPLDKIFLPSKRVMTALIFKIFVGVYLDELRTEERSLVKEISLKLDEVKSKINLSTEGKDAVDELKDISEWILDKFSGLGPFIENPSLLHTERTYPCSIYHRESTPTDSELEPFLFDSIQTLGVSAPQVPMNSIWGKDVDAECLQAFSSTLIRRRREEDVLRRLRDRLRSSKFHSIEFPPEDYAEYLRVRDQIGGTTRLLLRNIILETNFESEDIRKRYGVLDLAEAVQVVASKNPRSDIFLRDEIMKQSLYISVVLDVSRSMKVNEIQNRARAVCIAEAMKNVSPDPKNWAFYAFSDKLYVLKDFSEPYTRRVHARIGGVPFKGSTFMPDALVAAATFLKNLVEEKRIILLLSDGYPFGYNGIEESLGEVSKAFEDLGLMIVGLGFDTKRMESLFQHNASIYSTRELVEKMGNLFLLSTLEEMP